MNISIHYQPLLALAQFIVGCVLFCIIRRVITFNKIKATRIALWSMSMYYQLSNLILVSSLTWDVKVWIPALFQQLMFAQYIAESLILWIYNENFSSRFLKFIACHHCATLMIFLMWYCMMASGVIIVLDRYSIAISASVWNVAIIPIDINDIWLNWSLEHRDRTKAIIGAIVSRSVQVCICLAIYSYAYAWSANTLGDQHPKLWLMFTCPSIAMNVLDIHATVNTVRQHLAKIYAVSALPTYISPSPS